MSLSDDQVNQSADEQAKKVNVRKLVQQVYGEDLLDHTLASPRPAAQNGKREIDFQTFVNALMPDSGDEQAKDAKDKKDLSIQQIPKATLVSPFETVLDSLPELGL